MNSKPASLNGISVPYDTTVDALQTQLHPSGPQAWAAFVALGYHPDRDAFDLLVELLSCEDWCYRRAAIEALATHRFGRDAAELLYARLNDPSAYVVREACHTIATLGLHNAHDAVLALLRADVAATRITALQTLSTLWRPTDFAAVKTIYSADPSGDVRKQAAWTLRANASEEIWLQLFDLWQHDPIPRHRTWAGELAYAFGDCHVAFQLQALARDTDGHVRKVAQRALQQVGDACAEDRSTLTGS